MAKFQGLTFTPYRNLTDKEKNMSLYHLTKHFNFTWDYELGMYDSDQPGHPVKLPYSHEAFYDAMDEDDWADIYYCEENERYYIPTTRTMMQITQHMAA